MLRKWKIVHIKYTPFKYNPETSDLRFIPEVSVRIRYDRRPRTASLDL